MLLINSKLPMNVGGRIKKVECAILCQVTWTETIYRISSLE